MNKMQFINELAARTGRPAVEVRKFMDSFLTLTMDVLAREEDISFLGFGRFHPHVQASRPVRNPRTGASLMLEERTTVRFKPGKELFEVLNRK